MLDENPSFSLDSQLEELKRLTEVENFDVLQVEWAVNTGPNEGELQLFAQVVMEKGTSKITIQSSTPAFFQYCSHLRKSLNQKGEEQFKKLKDMTVYNRQLFELATNQEQKRHRAFERLTREGLPDDIDLYKLFKKYLKTRQWHAPKFFQLRKYYFETQVMLIDMLRVANNAANKIAINRPRSKKYYDQIYKLLRQAFQDKDNLVKSAIHFTEVAKFDFDYLLEQAMDQQSHMVDTINMLADRESIETARSLRYLLNFYRVHAEWATPFIRVLSDAVQIVNGNPPPPPNMGYRKRCEIIRSSAYKDIIKCLDPEIRHAESHLASVVDSSDLSIAISELNDQGERIIKVRYEFEEFVEMSSELIHGLFYALVSAFTVYEYELASYVALSKHYLLAILSIDQED